MARQSGTGRRGDLVGWEELLRDEYGRIRNVMQAPDGSLRITSNLSTVTAPRSANGTTASSGWGRPVVGRTPARGVESTTRGVVLREDVVSRGVTGDTLVKLYPVPGEGVDSEGYDGFVVVLDRVRAGDGSKVLGHVVAELWWFEGGAGVELWNDFTGEPPVRLGRRADEECRLDDTGAHPGGGEKA